MQWNIYEMIADVDKLSELELAMITYAALFHDIGMVVSEEEIEQIKSEKSYQVRENITKYWENTVMKKQLYKNVLDLYMVCVKKSYR